MLNEEFRFHNYCIIVFDNIDGVKEEIKAISENQVRFAASSTILIATFTSLLTTPLLKDEFIARKRSFLVFELNEKTGGGFFQTEAIHNVLLKIYEDHGEEIAKETTDRFMQDIQDFKKSIDNNNQLPKKNTSMKKNNRIPPKTTEIKPEISFNISSLSPQERNEKINDILDKPVEKWTPYDKIILKQLAETKLQ